MNIYVVSMNVFFPPMIRLILSSSRLFSRSCLKQHCHGEHLLNIIVDVGDAFDMPSKLLFIKCQVGKWVFYK